MHLSLHIPQSVNFIKEVQEGDIQILQQRYSHNITVSASLVERWNVQTVEQLDLTAFQPILDNDPEIVICGTGKTQRFLSAELMSYFPRNKIGFELMTTAAACRTYNILVHEGRKVIAALILDPVTRS